MGQVSNWDIILEIHLLLEYQANHFFMTHHLFFCVYMLALKKLKRYVFSQSITDSSGFLMHFWTLQTSLVRLKTDLSIDYAVLVVSIIIQGLFVYLVIYSLDKCNKSCVQAISEQRISQK